MGNKKPTHFRLVEKRRIKMENQAIDKDKFEPNNSYRTIYPWAEVMMCIDKTLPQEDFKDERECPKCGCQSEKLFWIQFYDLKDMWKGVSNNNGPLSICPNCKIQVAFIPKDIG